MPGVAESRRCSGGAKPNQDDGKRSIYLRRQLPRGAPPSKMSKTTPCKAAGVQRRNLTCRANRWYFSIIPKSRKPHRLRQGREPRSTSVADYSKSTRRRMSAGLAPAARNSRSPVARVDFDSF